MTAFQIPNTPDDSGGEHVKSTVSKNQVLCLVWKLFQTVNQDMCKLSEDGFSSVFAVLMVLIQSGMEAEKLVWEGCLQLQANKNCDQKSYVTHKRFIHLQCFQ